MPGQARPPLEALPAAGAAEAGVALLVDPLVVAEEAGQAEGFATRVADVPLLLGVDAHVVAQSHVVGVGLVAEGAAEVARLVRVLVVEQAAGMLVSAPAQVAGERALVPLGGAQLAGLHAQAGAVEGGRRRGHPGGSAVM